MTSGERNQFGPNSLTPTVVSLRLGEIVDRNRNSNNAGREIFLEIEALYNDELDSKCFDHVVCAYIFNIFAKYCKEIIPERLDPIAEYVLDKYLLVLTESGFRGIVNVIWALARLGCEDEDAIKAILDEAVKKVEEANPQEIANMLWATAVLGFSYHPIIGMCVDRAKKMMSNNLFNAKEIMQLYHFNLNTGLLPEVDSVFKDLETAGKLGISASVSRGEREIINEVKTIFAGSV